MTDVRLYIKDLLVHYARLQRFRPYRSEHSKCMNWKRMLEEFGVPYKQVLLRPWWSGSSLPNYPSHWGRCRTLTAAGIQLPAARVLIFLKEI
jgi:hypothetical protein